MENYILVNGKLEIASPHEEIDEEIYAVKNDGSRVECTHLVNEREGWIFRHVDGVLGCTGHHKTAGDAIFSLFQYGYRILYMGRYIINPSSGKP